MAHLKIPTEKKRSRAEVAWANGGYENLLGLPYLEGGRVIWMVYQYWRFNMPGGWYTPDFEILLDNGLVVIIEVKESKNQPNYRDARSKLRAAASLNPMFIWIEARYSRRGRKWEIERIIPDGFIIRGECGQEQESGFTGDDGSG